MLAWAWRRVGWGSQFRCGQPAHGRLLLKRRQPLRRRRRSSVRICSHDTLFRCAVVDPLLRCTPDRSDAKEKPDRIDIRVLDDVNSTPAPWLARLRGVWSSSTQVHCTPNCATRHASPAHCTPRVEVPQRQQQQQQQHHVGGLPSTVSLARAQQSVRGSRSCIAITSGSARLCWSADVQERERVVVHKTSLRPPALCARHRPIAPRVAAC
jgi:hypothetical protein